MRSGGVAAAVAMLAISSCCFAAQLGADAKAGLWEDHVRSNMVLVAIDPMNELPPEKRQKLSDALFTGHAGVLRMCATREEAQHPVRMMRLGMSCSPGNVAVEGHTARYDLTCAKNILLHMEVEFASPEHILITDTGNAMSKTPLDIQKHDLHWVSADCGDIKPGNIREIVPMIDHASTMEAYHRIVK